MGSDGSSRNRLREVQRTGGSPAPEQALDARLLRLYAAKKRTPWYADLPLIVRLALLSAWPSARPASWRSGGSSFDPDAQLSAEVTESQRSRYSARRFRSSPPLRQQTVPQAVRDCCGGNGTRQPAPPLTRFGKDAHVGRSWPVSVASRRDDVVPVAYHECVGGYVGQPAFVGVVHRDRGEKRDEIGMPVGDRKSVV